jgi:predicted RNA-binding protein with PIN domain
MPYLIDGHNLIPKVPGMDLDDLDDEQQLIELLSEFCNRQNKRAEVFFDNAAPGGARVRSFGRVLARFVRQGLTADEAIRKRLLILERGARNWTVVSSDHAVQAAAQAAQAQALSSEAFARQLTRSSRGAGPSPGKAAETALKPGEVDEWLELFSKGQADDQ